MAYEPGLTGSKGNLIHVEIDGDSEDNIIPKPEPEDSMLTPILSYHPI
jgi:hypothetical protein